MKTTLKSGFYLFLALAFATTWGCQKNNDRTNWNTDALIPLAYANLSIGDLIADSLLEVDENELVSLSFSDTIFTLKLDTLIDLPDTSVTEFFNIPIQFEVPPGTQLSNIAEDIRIESNDIDLRRATIQEGTVLLNLNSTFQGTVIATYTIPDATLNGVPLTVTESVPAASEGSPSSISLIVDVSGYNLDFTNGDEPFNSLPTLLTVVADPNGEPLSVSAGDGFELTTSFQGLRPSFAEGYFGQQTTDTGSELQEINAFNIIESGSIDLDEVSVNLKILNGLGVDIRANIQSFNALNSSLATNVGLNHTLIGSPINLNRATYSGETIYYSEYNIDLNNNNSDIDLMLESLPDAFETEAELELNPLGNVSNHHDFAFSKSTIAGVLDVDIPLCLIAEQLQLADTSDFSMGNEETLDNINSGTLIIQIDNGFPLEGWIDLIAINDEESTRTLLNDGHFLSSMTDSENIVSSATFSQISIALDRSDIEWLKSAGQIIIRARFNTSNLNEHIKIYSNYNIDLRVIADFNYNING